LPSVHFLVVVNNLDIIGFTVPPNEADSPLIVNADAVLLLSITA
jgi:hypothetical protein